MNTFSRLAAAIVPALVVVVAVPGTALAAGTFRNDDGTRETAIHRDQSDGTDTTWARFTLPAGHARGSTGATVWMYAQSANCGVPGPTQELRVNTSWSLYIDPCAVWPDTGYAWASFTVPVSALNDNNNFVQVLNGTGTGTGHTTYYGIDTSADVNSTTWQRDANGLVQLAGELMWYLDLTGSVPAAKVGPVNQDFGVRDVGSPSEVRTVQVTSNGLEELHPSVTVTGDADFAVTADTCTGAVLPTGASCTFGLVFTPGAPGPRAATLEIAAPDTTTRTFALTGQGRTGPPASAFTTADGATLFPGERVTGVVTSASPMYQEYVTFVPETPLQPTARLAAALSCNTARTSCTWSVERLTPGKYSVTANGVDTQWNEESPIAPIRVTVL